MAPSVSLLDLLPVQSRDDLTEDHLNLLAAARLPVTAWQEGNPLRSLTETTDELLSKIGQYVALIAAGGYPSTATADWLTVLGEDFFDEPRKPAARARHRVLVRDVGGVGPATFSPGQWIARGTGGLLFNLVTGGTVPLNGSLAFEVEAAATGPAYNLGVGEINSFVIDQPGFSITNPDLGDGTLSSLLALGADLERDADYGPRLPLKWDAQGRAGNADAWQFHALASDDQVRKALVLEHTPANGDVTVYLAGSTGPVPSLVLASATTYLSNNARPLGTNLYVNNASVLLVPVVAVVSVKASKRAAAVAQISAALLKYQLELAFGATVVRAKTFDAVSKPGDDTTLVADVAMTSPAANVTPSVGQLPVFVPQLTFVEV
jgi:phage-related baseplate assembly protein